MRILLPVLIVLSSIMTSKGQGYHMQSVKIGKSQGLKYLGTDETSFFFESYAKSYLKLYAFSKKDISRYTSVKCRTEKKREQILSTHLMRNYFYFITINRQSGYSYYKIYKLDPYSGKGLKIARFSFSSAGDVLVDTASGTFSVMKQNVLQAALNLELDSIKSLSPPASLAGPDYMKNIYLPKSFWQWMTMGESRTHIDSTSLAHYIVTHRKEERKDVFYFAHQLSGIIVMSKHYPGLTARLDIDKSRTVVDLYYLETREGQLLIVGKYLYKQGDSSYYGLFSARYDANLVQVCPVVYQTLYAVRSGSESLHQSPIDGFLFQPLPLYKHVVRASGHTCALTYDHPSGKSCNTIFILVIDASAKLSLQHIVHEMPGYSTYKHKATHFATCYKDSLYIGFYDHEGNEGFPSDSMEDHSGRIRHRSEALLVCKFSLHEPVPALKYRVHNMRSGSCLLLGESLLPEDIVPETGVLLLQGYSAYSSRRALSLLRLWGN